MKQNRDHILTSHAGSLPRPDDVIEANRARESVQASDERRFQAQLRSSVADVVRRQKDLGIAMPGDGEFGKSMGHRARELSGVVELLVPASGRARAWHHRALRSATAAVAAW